MMKRDSVFCIACGREFDVGLLELVRWSGPVLCEQCAADAVRVREEAVQEAERD